MKVNTRKWNTFQNVDSTGGFDLLSNLKVEFKTGFTRVSVILEKTLEGNFQLVSCSQKTQGTENRQIMRLDKLPIII